MRIRGHHLICNLGYKGKGYDERFTSVMSNVMYLIKMNPDLNVRVIDDIDILCSACPNRKGEKYCTNKDTEANKRIKQMDHLVLDILDIQPYSLHNWTELQKKIALDFKLEHLNKLCKNCEWRQLGYCRQGLLDLKEKYNLV
ncbi:hypothetical protein SH1V18_02510 [Vallitalea longa]|uniref:DUF1284 domain-containing protein n=1 Tax=Vallitalea longa TaxID=2936439 RepID=A0A9W5Y870_9FIRM|nr:DUF1284 domain-containing protein [Vallitalea longa]GKX27771.1 hypothetical protein SH1V18_02510 [Vallitalea longa]